METGGIVRQVGAELIYAAILGAFFTLIWFGYSTSISTSYPQLPQFVPGLLALVGVFIVYLCVRHTGHAWASWPTATALGRVLIIIWFFPLFIFSAFGVIAASMLLYEGPVICRDLMIEMNQAFSKLEASAQTLLRVKEIETVEAQTDALRKRLSEEIMNAEGGHLCGVGPAANRTLTELEQLLPTFRRPAAPPNPNHDCKKLDDLRLLVGQYQSLIDNALANLPIRTKMREQEKSALRLELKTAADEQIDNLQRGIARLSGVQTFALNLNLYRDSVITLEKANQVYVNYYQKLAGLVGANQIDAPASVNIAPAENVASIVQVFSSLYQRADKSSTWFYIVGAILVDLTAAYVSYRIISNAIRIDFYRIENSYDRKAGGTNVNYIWRPMNPKKSSVGRRA